jgi:hypothetical protein
VKLVIDLQKLTLDDLINLEDGANYRTMRQLIGRFVTDDAGEPVSQAQAEQYAGSLTIGQIKNVNEQISASLSGVISPEASGG